MGSLFRIGLLPHKNLVSRWYIRYSLGASATTLLTTMSGVLGTQSMLYALGCGTEQCIPASLSIQYVLKDSFGQCAGSLTASRLSKKIDANYLPFLMYAPIGNILAGYLEISTIVIPEWFLPITSVAVFGRNIAWIQTLSVKTKIYEQINKSTGGNSISQLSAVGSAQMTLASTLGIVLAAGMSLWIQNNIGWLLLSHSAISGLVLVSSRFTMLQIPPLVRPKSSKIL